MHTPKLGDDFNDVAAREFLKNAFGIWHVLLSESDTPEAKEGCFLLEQICDALHRFEHLALEDIVHWHPGWEQLEKFLSAHREKAIVHYIWCVKNHLEQHTLSSLDSVMRALDDLRGVNRRLVTLHVSPNFN